ncbi:MAG: hypothetical protein K6B70_05830 [Clostridia bacterium]|nr:hypothetical protein [Clostridia bacterium]
MKLKIHEEFQKILIPIREEMQIIKWKITLRKMNQMLGLMKRKKKELDDPKHQSNSTRHRKTLYEKYSI